MKCIKANHKCDSSEYVKKVCGTCKEYNKKQLTCTHIIPLIGPFIYAAKVNDIKTERIFSFNVFKDNEIHIKPNYNLNIEYLNPSRSIETIGYYKKYLELLKYKSTDFMFSLCPCAGLSILTSGVDPKHRDSMNQWMLEAFKFFLASDCKMLMFENAFEITYECGLVVLNKIQKMLPKEYKIHIMKCSTVDHGLPQNRRRAFIYIYKSNFFILPKIEKQPRVSWHDFLKRSKNYGGQELHTPENNRYNKYHSHMVKENIYKKMRDKLADIERNNISLFGLLRRFQYPIKDLCKDKTTKFYKIMKDMATRRAVWDSSAVMYKNYCGAITKKNCMSIIHPRYDRPLSYREVMDLMGLPDDFKLIDPIRNFNHICQNTPLPTVTAYVKAAKDIYNKIGGKFIGKAQVLMQDNIKGRISTLDKNNEWQRHEYFEKVGK